MYCEFKIAKMPKTYLPIFGNSAAQLTLFSQSFTLSPLVLTGLPRFIFTSGRPATHGGQPEQPGQVAVIPQTGQPAAVLGADALGPGRVHFG